MFKSDTGVAGLHCASQLGDLVGTFLRTFFRCTVCERKLYSKPFLGYFTQTRQNVVKALLHEKADVNICTSTNVTSLHAASLAVSFSIFFGEYGKRQTQTILQFCSVTKGKRWSSVVLDLERCSCECPNRRRGLSPLYSRTGGIVKFFSFLSEGTVEKRIYLWAHIWIHPLIHWAFGMQTQTQQLID